VLHRICHDTPRPIREINPEIAGWLVGIIERLLKKDAAERFQSAKEVAELLGQYLAHALQPAIVTLPGKELVSPKRQPGVRRWRWSVAVVALLAVTFVVGLTDASGVTSFVPTVIRIVRGEGTLVIEVADPTVKVSLDGEELSIRGVGIQELRLIPGKYRLHATKDRQPVKDEIVTITRCGREVAKVTLESSGRAGSSSSGPAAEERTRELKLLAKLDGHSDAVRGVAFSPDGSRIVTAGGIGEIKVWDAALWDNVNGERPIAVNTPPK
jgi:WD40 repeat protein